MVALMLAGALSGLVFLGLILFPVGTVPTDFVSSANDTM